MQIQVRACDGRGRGNLAGEGKACKASSGLCSTVQSPSTVLQKPAQV